MFPSLPVYTMPNNEVDSTAPEAGAGAQANSASPMEFSSASASASVFPLSSAPSSSGAPAQSATVFNAPESDRTDNRDKRTDARLIESDPRAQTIMQQTQQQTSSELAAVAPQKSGNRSQRSQDPSRGPISDIQLAMRPIMPSPTEFQTASTSSSSTSSPSSSLRIVIPSPSSELPLLPSSPLTRSPYTSVQVPKRSLTEEIDVAPNQSVYFKRAAAGHLSERMHLRGEARAASLMHLEELSARSAASTTNGGLLDMAFTASISGSYASASDRQSPFFSWPLPAQFVVALQKADSAPPLSPSPHPFAASSSSSGVLSRNSTESSGEQQQPVRHPPRGGPSSDELDRLISAVYSFEVRHLAAEGSLHAYLTAATATPMMKRHPTEARTRKLGDQRGPTRAGVRLNVRSLPYYANILKYRDPVRQSATASATNRSFTVAASCTCVEWEGLSLATHVERALRLESELQSADTKLPLCLREVLKEQHLLRQAAPPAASVHRENIAQHKRDLAALEFHRQSLEVRCSLSCSLGSHVSYYNGRCVWQVSCTDALVMCPLVSVHIYLFRI